MRYEAMGLWMFLLAWSLPVELPADPSREDAGESEGSGPGGGSLGAIACSAAASPLEILAAREICRYVYLRTGKLLPIEQFPETLPGAWSGIAVARKDRSLLGRYIRRPGLRALVDGLEGHEYVLRTFQTQRNKVFMVIGGEDVGTLYAAYAFAEHLGVRFYLHGDVIPDHRIDPDLPAVQDHGKPLFDLRGIQPFHDFPEGPDWWNADDYKAIISQLPKLRMNFFGLHTYPEGGPNAEPTVWIGLPSEIGEGVEVKASYPASYQNTLRGNWGYAAKKTGAFLFGAAALFDRDEYGAEVMKGACPQPEGPESCNALFARTGTLLGDAFRHARSLGVKTCVGTETPLTVPARVRERLQAAGRDPKDPAVVKELYEGIFLRAARAYPLDYYWFWTPEGWTWGDASSDTVKNTLKDLETAIDAWKTAAVPFQLATCGWVLGPQDDRALFDKVLPPGMAVSCINRQVGNEPVDPAFERVKNRPKWAIPWLEDDPGLTSPQLWVGRMRRDAADARRYGCTGLMGIHWRTRVLGPNVLALAWAAWNQEPWSTARAQPEKVAGPVGGQAASFPDHAIQGTEDGPLYQTVRYDVKAYHIPLPDGKYTVTLKFCEPHYGAAGKRVFGVKLQGKQVIDKLDIFATAGKDKALDYTYENIDVAGGWLDIDFVHEVEFPSIAAFVVEGSSGKKKVNCGGPAYKDYDADWPAAPASKNYPPTEDFYRDWASSEFGAEVGPDAAKVFIKMDGALPRPADWVDGPGGTTPDARLWADVSREYSFVEDLAALRPRVKGAGDLERFDWWLGTFRYMRSMAELRCIWAELQKAMERAKAVTDPASKAQLSREVALPVRKKLVEVTGEVYARLLETVSNPGEMGTVANWEQHILPSVLVKTGADLEALLGEKLPADAQPWTDWRGPPRVIVPTIRTSVNEGESLELKVIILSKGPLREADLRWRPLGQESFQKLQLSPVARGVLSVKFPEKCASGVGFEYCLQATMADGSKALFPATAPALCQTVVVMPKGKGQ